VTFERWLEEALDAGEVLDTAKAIEAPRARFPGIAIEDVRGVVEVLVAQLAVEPRAAKAPQERE
jgi:hypothetical protein